MKPLKLEFSGLHSYRDTQTVDFEELGQSGLFGIFGPTGSGKSTILDAITLALYGNVDRAAHGTRGIINSQESSTEVCFTFELGGSRYEVSRKYGRPSDDPDSARARAARLVCNGSEVLADKPDAVTAEIQRIIGLTPDEFCRAVVLPQGKFDEFLKLRGAERADMLGHIFNLERFGERLYRAADRRRDYHQKQIDEAETAKSAIGDCADAAIQSAHAEAEKAKEEAKRIEDAHQEARKQLEDATALKKLNDDLKAVQARRAVLDAQKSSIEQAQEKLDAARRAAPLKTAIDAITRLTSDREKASEKAQRAALDRDTAQTELSDAESEARRARERQEEEEPLLIQRKTKLETALGEKAKLEELTARRDEVSKAVHELEAKIRAAEQAVSDREGELRTLAGSIESLEQRRLGLAVDSDLRERVDAAAALLTPLESAKHELGRSQRDLDGKRTSSDKTRSRVLRVFASLSGIAASRYSLTDTGVLVETSPTIPSMDDAKSGEEFLAVADREIAAAGSLVFRASELEKQALIQEQAAVLAVELEDGKPCPVCGSIEHPRPAAGETGFSDRTRESRAVLEDCLAKLHSWKTELQARVTDWDNAKQNEFQAANAVRDRQEELEQTIGRFREVARLVLGDSYDEDTARTMVGKARQQIADKDRERPRVEKELNGAREKESATRKLLDEANKMLAAAQNLHSAKTSELSALSEQVQNLDKTLRDMTGGVDPSLGIASVESSLKSLRESVKKAAAQEEPARNNLTERTKAVASAESALRQIETELKEYSLELEKGLESSGFGSAEEATASWLPEHSMRELEKRIGAYNTELSEVNGQLSHLTKQIGEREFSEEKYFALDSKVAELREQEKAARDAAAVAKKKHEDLLTNRIRWDEWEAKKSVAEKKRDVAAQLARMVRERSFVKFLAEEYLRDMAADASARLGSLTGQRYALEIREVRGESDFAIRDDFNGGQRRPVNTLSGGETFLTSLSLALALSSQVQLRGQYPLGFFFLDEGFGTLDEEKLDAVIGALERLHDKNRLVGVISHVKELKERLPYYLEVVPVRGDGSGSRVAMRRN